MNQQEWDEATDVEEVPVKDTEPAPPPASTVPPPFVYVGPCGFCAKLHGEHDPACPLVKAIAP